MSMMRAPEMPLWKLVWMPSLVRVLMCCRAPRRPTRML